MYCAAATAHGMLQVKGQILIEEYSSHSDPEDVVFTVTAEGSGPEQVGYYNRHLRKTTLYSLARSNAGVCCSSMPLDLQESASL